MMKWKFLPVNVGWIFVGIACAVLPCEGQTGNNVASEFGVRQLVRAIMPVPKGRSASLRDVRLAFYSNMNSTAGSSENFRLKSADKLLSYPDFDVNKQTVIYAPGYVELVTDESAQTIVSAYRCRGGHNIVVVDWANLAFGNYIRVGLNVPVIGKEVGVALERLIQAGLRLESLHLVGHSLGAHLLAYAARYLASQGIQVHRLMGLDPALPGYYPSVLGAGLGPADAGFVGAVHTDGGGYGVGRAVGHADWWPNGGRRPQPGCPAGTVTLTDSDFCSHWRSWAYWAEAVRGGAFLARGCRSAGQCPAGPLVPMGPDASPDLRGNFYLRTAASEPYALGEAGAEP